MSFSQRQGLKPVKTILQIGSIDVDLMNRIWNIILEDFIKKFENNDAELYHTKRSEICRIIWKDFFNRRVDGMPTFKSFNSIDPELCIIHIRIWFDKAKWYEVYDLIEFISGVNISYISKDSAHIQEAFIQECNSALKKEVAGYRIIDGRVTQITSGEEIQAIEDAASNTDKLKLVSLHIKAALDLLADRKNPDYRNSIKESISAVESIAKLISGNLNDSLGGAIDKIKGKIKIHPALERGFKQIYGYTSDADGIRHGLTQMTDCDFEDAKFMLVSCSAFINYLITKSAKAGITFE